VMEKRSGKQLGEEGLNMADTLGSRWAKLADVPEEIFKSMKDTQGFKDISDTIGKLVDLFGPDSEIGQSIRSTLGSLLDEIGAQIKGIDWSSFGKQISEIIGDFKELIEPLKTVAELIGTVAKAVMSLPKIGNAIGDFMAESLDSDINSQAQRVRDKYMQKQIAMSERAQGSAANEKAWAESGADAVLAGRNIAAGLESGVQRSKLEDVGRFATSAIDEGVTSSAEIHSPSRLFQRHGRMLGEGLAIGMESSESRLERASGYMIPAPPETSGMGGGAGFSAGGITVQVVVNVGGSSGSPQEIGRESADQTVAALLPVLEQFAVQAGLA
jgi:hypothetical protein